MKHLIYISIILIGISSCSKKNEEPNEALAPEPSIKFVSLDTMEVQNFKNSITLTIKYKDNNGDLGFDDPDEFCLWVKDSRLDSADYYHVPSLSPPGKSLIIEGTLEIVLNSIFIIGNGSEELASLSIKMRDRANHWSNIIHTPAIKIKK